MTADGVEAVHTWRWGQGSDEKTVDEIGVWYVRDTDYSEDCEV
jgi:hypothetical protein